MAIKLTGVQRERSLRLEAQLDIAVAALDLKLAKTVVFDLQDIYLRFQQTRLYAVAKCRLFQIAIEVGDLSFAEEGLDALRLKLNGNTRMYLEVTMLQVICHIRKGDIPKAETYIKEVLASEYNIKSKNKRLQFYKEVIQRIEEEGAFYAIKDLKREPLDNINEIVTYAEVLALKSEKEILKTIGQAVPQEAKKILFRLDTFAKKQLPTAERLQLPSPQQALEDSKVGETMFTSVKRHLHKTICDPNGHIYQTITKKNMDIAFNKYFLTGTIIESLVKIGIGIKALIIPLIALILKLGIHLYCEKLKPNDLMSLR